MPEVEQWIKEGLARDLERQQEIKNEGEKLASVTAWIDCFEKMSKTGSDCSDISFLVKNCQWMVKRIKYLREGHTSYMEIMEGYKPWKL